MRKRVFGHMRTAKAQVSLRIRTIWSGPSLSANRIIGYYRMFEWRAKIQMILCAYAGWSEPAHFAHVRRHIFASRDPLIMYICLLEFNSVGWNLKLIVKKTPHKNINDVTVKWPQSRSTAFPRHRNTDKTQHRCIMHHTHKEELQRRNRLGTVGRSNYPGLNS